MCLLTHATIRCSPSCSCNSMPAMPIRQASVFDSTRPSALEVVKVMQVARAVFIDSKAVFSSKP